MIGIMGFLAWVGRSGGPSDGEMEALRHFCKLVLLQGGIIRCKVGFFIILETFFKDTEATTEGRLQAFLND